MLDWKIYYSDGNIFSSTEGTPWVAPPRDVQVIVILDKDHGWRTQAQTDYYVWDNRGGGYTWWGVDIFGLFDYLLDPGFRRVLFGRTIASDEFDKIYKRASNDVDFPKKTSSNCKERKA